MHFNLIGAGRLGKALAIALQDNKLASLNAVCNASWSSTRAAVSILGFGQAVASLDQIPAAELTFITVPDACIEPVAHALSSSATPGGIFVHCSGVLGSEVLQVLRDRHCHVASIHPLKAFKDEKPDPEIFKGCYLTAEGDEKAIEVTNFLFTRLGARVPPLQAKNKALYHAAAVMAANYTVTLASLAMESFEQAGLDALMAREITLDFMRDSLENIKQASNLQQALTGPVLRGDQRTLELHLQALSDPVLSAFYRAAALATLPLTPLNEDQKMALRLILNSAVES